MKFLNCDYYGSDEVNTSRIYFITHNQLLDKLEDKKVIILSATANEWMYRKLYGDRVKFIDISNVELSGKIIQKTKFTGARQNINNNLEEIVKELDSLNVPVITYKKYKGNFKNAVQDIYLGKVTGIDYLKGKDLAVIGHYYIRPIQYLLYAAMLGVDIKPLEFRMYQQVVKRNGLEFRAVTFDNPDLQEIQFHFIESELRQAIGRARLVRESATVYLYSGYPLPEACVNDEETANK